MKGKLISILVVLLSTQVMSFAQPQLFTVEKAAEYFKEVKAICDRDNGKLWGMSMWVPTLFIDYGTRHLVANEQDINDAFVRKGDVYTGKFPEDKIIANSTTNLKGKSWVMVIAPLPHDSYIRNQLVIHEMFHYIQDKLGLTPAGRYDNNHMDEMEARIYLKLEWSALNKVIVAGNDSDKKNALTDALIFRAYRRQLYPNAELSENRFEMHEGLPDYTGHKLCTSSKEELKEKLLQSAEYAWYKESYVRSFGYYSGFAYAYFLDGSDWQQHLTSDTDLAKLVQNHYNLTLPQDIEKAQEERRGLYSYQEIYDSELAFKQKKDELYAINKQKFEDGATLILSLQAPNVGFDPNNLQAFGDKGAVYPNMMLVDVWGSLMVQEGGCLLAGDWETATVSAKNIKINGDEVKGEGWELKLNDGYTIVEDGSGYKMVLKK
ncbi:MAG: hypothetical protein LBG19_10190 [Prevotellaceae bacterium]|nr:hypothetical protein [Prevotellaceae bacterium]